MLLRTQKAISFARETARGDERGERGPASGAVGPSTEKNIKPDVKTCPALSSRPESHVDPTSMSYCIHECFRHRQRYHRLKQSSRRRERTGRQGELCVHNISGHVYVCRTQQQPHLRAEVLRESRICSRHVIWAKCHQSLHERRPLSRVPST